MFEKKNTAIDLWASFEREPQLSFFILRHGKEVHGATRDRNDDSKIGYGDRYDEIGCHRAQVTYFFSTRNE